MITTCVASVVVAAGQQPQARQVIDVQKIADNYYVLTSSTPGNVQDIYDELNATSSR